MFWFNKEKDNEKNEKDVMFYDANVLAEYIITKCVREDIPISNLQLQKILYFIQYNFLKNFSVPAFFNKIEAWPHGPVVPDVYYEFAYMAGNPIVREFNIGEELFLYNADLLLVNKVTESCRSLRPWHLVDLTHKDGSPWKQVYQEGKKNEITLQIIAKYAKERQTHEK